ncbi:30S ribosomal protein S18 [Candidatus Uhrbacteria bacterium]|nr:30S ribosomal protein S18 [Candidatus Uhrbacteria bacterium]
MNPKAKSAIAKRRSCSYCVHTSDIDYKNTKLLRRSVSSYGKIVSRKRSGTCATHQRELARAIKLARVMALLPFVNK